MSVNPESSLSAAGGIKIRFSPAIVADLADIRPPAFTDDALALLFSERYADHLRYVAEGGRWYEWNGKVWSPDKNLHSFDLARKICREASVECNDHHMSKKLAAATTVAAVERLAKSDQRHASTIDQWDTDAWLLNTPGGVVNLKTGITREHRPGDHMTKITAVGPGEECPVWDAFLATVTNGDVERQKFLQRVAGYNLTGDIRDQALFFYYGTGGNGKGVFLNTLTGVMGDYAAVASMETFTASAHDRHPADLAMLRGARLVTAQETEEGRKWAESKIKMMTGGDPITARFMRQDYFTFAPTFKLNIAGNHKPALRNVDEAIRRRFNLLPFDVKIAAAQRDPDLPEKLKAEWPGILQWMIAGCLEWQRIGLAQPNAVTAATEEYFESEDAFGLWFKDCAVESKNDITASHILFKSWTTWAEQAGEPVGSQKRFSQTLTARGYEKTRVTTTGPDRSKPAFKGIMAAIPVRKSYYDGDQGSLN